MKKQIKLIFNDVFNSSWITVIRSSDTQKKKNTHAPHVHNMKSIEEKGTWERDREIRENKDSTHKRTHELKHFVFFFCKKEQKEERIKQNKT